MSKRSGMPLIPTKAQMKELIMAKNTKAADAATTAAPAAAAPAAEAPAAVVKVAQNGVTRPKDGTTTGRVWAISDEISKKKGEPADRKTVIEQVVAEGINASTGATQYGKWRKFHGLVGEQAPGRAAKPAETAPATEGAAPTPPAAPAAAPTPVEETDAPAAE